MPNCDRLLRLSQSHLTALASCPPQLQARYLEQSTMPPSLNQQTQAEWGRQFHRLMQQKILGLPLDYTEPEGELRAALASLVQATPELWQDSAERWQAAEHSRTLLFQGYLLSAIYDLLIIEEGRSQIWDWKTYPKPPNTADIEQSWQTRLYLYILAETTDLRPDQLSMTYWFVRPPQLPQSLTLAYNQALHELTHTDLTQLLTQLDGWLDDYHTRQTPFPHRADCLSACPFAPDGLAPSALPQNPQAWQQLLATIPEVTLAIQDREEVIIDWTEDLATNE